MKRRDDAATLCASLHPSLYGALVLYCGSSELAEDLTQETLLRVWREWEAVSAMEFPDRWALRGVQPREVGVPPAAGRAPGRGRGRRAGTGRARSHRRDRDPRRGRDLPPRQRAVVVLRYFNDLSIADTAVILDCAEGTVKALTHQAVANLRLRFGAVLADTEEDTDA